MKTRTGFVSNSSSSSFMIPRSALTDEQVEMIVDHIDRAKEIDPKGYGFEGQYYCTAAHDAWDIKVTEHFVGGFTTMDNFDMITFLERDVKVDKENIHPEHGHFWRAPWEEDKDED